ncbi:MAG: hypothetical protein GF353_25705 [Candidatus Lokiarchaeota archaeon]|nr:hypothetical protein [Candidatus Lokiarchaeota archaeon]
MEIRQTLRSIAGIFSLLLAFSHFFFTFIDFRGAISYYWIFENPKEYQGIEGIAVAGLGALIALVLSILHGICYLISGALLILLMKKNFVSIGSIGFTSLGIFLTIRMLGVFKYLSVLILFHVITEIIVIIVCVFSLVLR